MQKSKYCIVFALLLTACGYFSDSLTENDIIQYVTAYENLAAISPELEQKKKQSNSQNIFTCEKCRELMTQAVKNAGYSSFQSFLVMEVRLSYTMKYVAYVRISRLVGDLSKDVAAEDLCAEIESGLTPNSAQRDKFNEYCTTASAYAGYIERIGGLVNSAVTRLMQQADIELVDQHFDKIHAALTNDSLAADLNHSAGDWDD